MKVLEKLLSSENNILHKIAEYLKVLKNSKKGVKISQDSLMFSEDTIEDDIKTLYIHILPEDFEEVIKELTLLNINNTTTKIFVATKVQKTTTLAEIKIEEIKSS